MILELTLADSRNWLVADSCNKVNESRNMTPVRAWLDFHSTLLSALVKSNYQSAKLQKSFVFLGSGEQQMVTDMTPPPPRSFFTRLSLRTRQSSIASAPLHSHFPRGSIHATHALTEIWDTGNEAASFSINMCHEGAFKGSGRKLNVKFITQGRDFVRRKFYYKI